MEQEFVHSGLLWGSNNQVPLRNLQTQNPTKTLKPKLLRRWVWPLVLQEALEARNQMRKGLGFRV